MIQGYRLSPQQRRVWTLGLSDRAAVCVVQMDGELDTAALREAITQVVSRHEILRTTFKLLPGMTLPVQVISDSAEYVFESHDDVSVSELAERRVDHEQVPLFRVDLVRRSSSSHDLIISLPVLCADTQSLQKLTDQIAVAYGKAAFNVEVLQYADFAEWRNELLESDEGAAGRRHWRQQDLSEVDSQKLAFEKRTDAGFQRAVQTVEISVATSARIRVLADHFDTQPSAFALACWQLLLSRLTGQTNVVVGVACEGRKFAELEEAIGLFSSFVPVRSEITPDLSFQKFLQQTARQELEAERWQEYFAWDRFFPFCFEFHKNTNLCLFVALADRFNIKFVFQDHGDRFSASLEFDANVLSSDDVRRLAAQLTTLIEDASKRPEAAISNLEILTAAERQLFAEVNNTRRSYPSRQLIHELFEQQASEKPDEIAVVYETEQLTYRDLNARANQLAHHLIKLGVGPDHAVGLRLERSTELIVGLLGIMKAGGAYVPLDPGLPPARQKMILDESGARVLVTNGSADEIFSERVVSLDEDAAAIAQESSSNPSRVVCEEHLAYVIFTSGSTGLPKGVAIEHRQIRNYLNAVWEKLDVPAASSFAMVSTIAADLGNTALFPALCKGGTLHLIGEERSSDPNGLAEYFSRHQVDCLKIVPTHLSALLSAANPAGVLPRRRLILGGEACPWNLVDRIAMLSPECVVINHYGPTEATVGAITYRISGDNSAYVSETVPLGGPIGNVQTYILDEQLRPVPIGAAGELHIGGAGLARGYINRPEATAEKFIPSPFGERGERLYKTGDRASYLSDGRIEFLGRIDNQVKIRGNRIELREIEIALRGHDAITDNVVIAREDSHGDKRLVAYLVTREHKTLSPSDLRAFLHERLPDYMVPASFVFLDRLPLTPNGKLDRAALPSPDHARTGGERIFQEPRNEVEKSLSQIWSNVLGVERVGVHDNFFDLGGDSILSIQIIAKANQAGLSLTPRQLFQHQTVAELAEVAGVAVATQAEQGIVTGPVPLTPVQSRFFELDQPEIHHYNQSILLEVKGPVEAPVLQRAIELLLVQHDALRLRYARTEQGWTQTSVAPDGIVPFETVDLSSLSDDKQRSAIAEHAAGLHASLNLQNGPLIRVALFDRGARQNNYLLIVIHHLAVDGVSWRILLEDLHALYQQLSRREEPSLPPKTTSFKEWAERLSKHARSGDLNAELSYWCATADKPPAQLPLDHAGGTNSVASARTISVSLNTDETRELLQAVPAAYRTQVNEVLLTALVRALTSWSGLPALLVDLEGHGREEIVEGSDLSRTVGWFTTIFPVVLDVGESQTPLDVLRAVKEQVRMIPNRGIGYGLLKYAANDNDAAQKLRNLPQAEVRFNYLGQVDRVLLDSSMFALAPHQTGPAQSLKAQRAYLLNIIAMVTGGELRLDWTYSENIHRSETIQHLAQRYLEELRALIEQSRRGEEKVYSPSDFPSANISQEDLSKVLAKLRG